MSKISIIVPTYNVEKYIARALESCINQTFKDIEIIVVDDCGNDKSIEIAKEYAKKDTRIKIIHNKTNLGTFAARNNGVKHSNSEYLMFLDPDDYLELDICKIAMENINEYVLLSFSYVKINKNNYEIFSAKWKNWQEYLKIIKKKQFTPWNLCNLIVKKDFYLKQILLSFQNYNLIFAEDLFVFALLINEKIKSIEYVGYYYIVNDNSITNLDKVDEKLADCEKILKLIRNSKINLNVKKYYLYFLNIEILDCKYRLHFINKYYYKIIKIGFHMKKKLKL
ncbi:MULTISPECIES: glycosyltransferase family 2 protein [Campylobacter]|nr:MULTISPECIES: glycosyltransferase family 2 protein [Campylobacter]OEW42619.1 hypothetical protein AJ885_02690 [Campylobacter sp. BCW_6464]OEW20139.1 hypothetical protein AJ939_07275 [Campylobacter sp. BCW_6889]OEW24388.1 hypothetical protein AJ874_07385 [Campylobacter jejuni]OEW36638.1 hypothetical protein AJ880_01725 [Campylobacter jejuni]RTI65184.1 glycosyltransferase family 2 protein [Campylobacter jejuni]